MTAETTQNGSGFSGTQTYSVDAFNRLLNMTEVSGNAGQGYTYDQFGNRAVTSGYVPNNLTPQSLSSFAATTNRLVAPFTYDGMGNLTFDGLNTSVYDGENRLFTSSQTSFGTTTTLQYTYHPEGRRVQVQQTGGSGPNTVYVHDAGGSLIAEYSNAALPAAATLYLSTDHLGSTRLITGAGASISRCYDYLPFGEEIISGTDGRAACYETGTQTTTPDVTPVKFTGKERDSETGLDYFGARYMSSAQGRFASIDPAFESEILEYPQTWNRYSYVYSNPLRFTDPDGRCPPALRQPWALLSGVQLKVG